MVADPYFFELVFSISQSLVKDTAGETARKIVALVFQSDASTAMP